MEKYVTTCTGSGLDGVNLLHKSPYSTVFGFLDKTVLIIVFTIANSACTASRLLLPVNSVTPERTWKSGKKRGQSGPKLAKGIFHTTSCLAIETGVKQGRGVQFVLQSSCCSETGWALVCLSVGGSKWLYLHNLGIFILWIPPPFSFFFFFICLLNCLCLELRVSLLPLFLFSPPSLWEWWQVSRRMGA